MLDLYTFTVPIFGVIALASLLVLKLAIKDNVTMIKIKQKSQLSHHPTVEKQESAPTKNTVKHFLLNFTPLEICAVRRAKYKVCLLLSLSIIAAGTFLVPSPYYFVATGSIVYFTYFFVVMAMTHSSEGEDNSISKKNR